MHTLPHVLPPAGEGVRPDQGAPVPAAVNAKTILVVEDDAAIRRGLVDALRFARYHVKEAADGEAGLAAALDPDLDLVLLDILMPRLDGMVMLRRLRTQRPALPVIFLTAKGQEEDRVRGLRAGADDYVVKPFSATEVLARIEAVLRRSADRPRPLPRLTILDREIDFSRRQVTFPDGESIVLPELEAQVLAYLASCRDRAVSREELLQRVWGLDPRNMQTRTVDMAVARLRVHLRDDPDVPGGNVIITVRGKGYMLAGAPSESAAQGDASLPPDREPPGSAPRAKGA